jgi:hypothetical protein
MFENNYNSNVDFNAIVCFGALHERVLFLPFSATRHSNVLMLFLVNST